MNEITDNILVNLKIISKIAPNNKLKLIHNTTTIEKEGIASWILRWYNGDSREKTVNFIKIVLADAINMTNDIMNSTYINNKNRRTTYEETEYTKSLSTLFLIKNELYNSKTGIINLQKTYELDIQIISQLEVVMNKIDGHLGIIERKLKEIHASEVNTTDLKDSRETRESKDTKEVKVDVKDTREPKENNRDSRDDRSKRV